VVTFSRETAPAEPALTPEAARSEIHLVLSNPDDLYHAQHASTIGHDARVLEVTKLFEVAHPQPGQEVPPPDTAPAALPLPVGPAPEGREWNREFLQTAKGAAEDLGVSASEAAEIVQYCVSRDPAACPDSEAALTTLREEWGNRTDFNILAAQLVARRLDPVFFEALNGGLGDDPGLIRRFAAKGQELAKAFLRIQAIQQDRAHPYTRWQDPKHQEAVVEMRALHEVVYGTRRVG